MPVLKIKKNGVWETVGGGGSVNNADANTVVVQIDEINNTASMSKSEIEAAIDDGKVVFALTSLNNEIYKYDGIMFSSSTTYSVFVSVNVSETAVSSKVLYIDDSKNVTSKTIEVSNDDTEEEVFIVEIDVDNETASHTPSEIAAAVEAGKVVIANTKSSLLFNGVIFHFFSTNADNTSAEFKYTYSNLAETNTYTYTIDENKNATLTTYSIDVGNLNDLETNTKMSIVAAINEVAASSAGSGESDVLVVTMLSDTTASHSMSEIQDATAEGKFVVFMMNGMLAFPSLNSTTSEAIAFTHIESLNEDSPASVIVEYEFYVDNEKNVTARAINIPCVPTPTESDYGKVLSATADGLVWVEQSGGGSVPSAEGVEF